MFRKIAKSASLKKNIVPPASIVAPLAEKYRSLYLKSMNNLLNVSSVNPSMAHQPLKLRKVSSEHLSIQKNYSAITRESFFRGPLEKVRASFGEKKKKLAKTGKLGLKNQKKNEILSIENQENIKIKGKSVLEAKQNVIAATEKKIGLRVPRRKGSKKGLLKAQQIHSEACAIENDDDNRASILVNSIQIVPRRQLPYGVERYSINAPPNRASKQWQINQQMVFKYHRLLDRPKSLNKKRPKSGHAFGRIKPFFSQINLIQSSVFITAK